MKRLLLRFLNPWFIVTLLFFLVVGAGYGIGIHAVMVLPDHHWWQLLLVNIAFQGSIGQSFRWLKNAWRATGPNPPKDLDD